jgi:hypothetical protein
VREREKDREAVARTARGVLTGTIPKAAGKSLKKAGMQSGTRVLKRNGNRLSSPLSRWRECAETLRVG